MTIGLVQHGGEPHGCSVSLPLPGAKFVPAGSAPGTTGPGWPVGLLGSAGSRLADRAGRRVHRRIRPRQQLRSQRRVELVPKKSVEAAEPAVMWGPGTLRRGQPSMGQRH